MAYILKNQPPTAAGRRRFATFIALVGLVLTIAQIAYISGTGSALCLNDGCAIVESLTRLPPVFFNAAGACFFFVMLILLRLGKTTYNRHDFWLRMVGVALLAAMAAEGVLLSFQLQVSRAWCAYCLVIFACVFLLNLSLGGRQFIRGMAALVAVVAASASLNYVSPTDMAASRRGSYGEIVRPDSAIDARLYFSAACPHCEEIIASLDEDFSCQMSFYPLETVPELRVVGLKKNPRYDSAVNRALLQGLGLHEVPVLIAQEGKETRVISGKESILAFLARCRPASMSPDGQSPVSSGQSTTVHSGKGDAEESCPVGVACPATKTSAPH